MTKVKKIIAIITLIALVTTLGLFLASCVDDVPALPVTVTIYIGDTKYELPDQLNNQKAFDMLKIVCERNDIKLVYTDSAYGAYISQIGNLVASDSNRTFISIYTNDLTNKDVGPYCETFVHDGVTMYSSGLGASDLPLVEGCVYLFKLSSW